MEQDRLQGRRKCSKASSMMWLLWNLAFLLLLPNRGKLLQVIMLSATIQLDHWQSCSDLLKEDLVVCELLQLEKALSVKINELQKEWAIESDLKFLTIEVERDSD